MAVGDSALFSGLSYLSMGRESTFGTGVTCTAALDFISSSMKVVKETKILEQIATSRTYAKQIKMGKVISGDVEAYFYPKITACAYVLENVFGSDITTATATGETTGGGALTHTFVTGSYTGTNKSLSMNHRKGPSSTGRVFEYNGMRINSMAFTGELDDALKFTMNMIAQDATQTSNDVSSALSVNSVSPLSFVGGRLSVEGTFASLTSSSFWHIQSVNFTINNNLKSDNEARRIGSDILSVLPIGIQNYELSFTIRFDTTTAYDAMIANTEYALEFEFAGDTMSGSALAEGIKFQFPSIRISDAGDPEIGGPDEVLQSEVVCAILRDDSSATGYACRALLTNDISSY